MRPGVKANIYCDTQAHANTIKDRLEAAIGRLRIPPLVEESPTVIDSHGRWLVNCSLRCNTELDADQWYSDATATWISAVDRNRITAGSFVQRFNAHDDEVEGPPDEPLYGLTRGS